MWYDFFRDIVLDIPITLRKQIKANSIFREKFDHRYIQLNPSVSAFLRRDF